MCNIIPVVTSDGPVVDHDHYNPLEHKRVRCMSHRYCNSKQQNGRPNFCVIFHNGARFDIPEVYRGIKFFA